MDVLPSETAEHKCFADKIKDAHTNYLKSPSERQGISRDHQVIQASAKNELVWEGIGLSPSLTIWRITKNEVVLWPRFKHGKFYVEDCYLVLNTHRCGKASGDLHHDLHIWVGNQSSDILCGTAAYRMVELQALIGRHTTQHRETTSEESCLFLSYFGGKVESLQKELQNHVQSVVKSKKKSRKKGVHRLMQVFAVDEASISSLDSRSMSLTVPELPKTFSFENRDSNSTTEVNKETWKQHDMENLKSISRNSITHRSSRKFHSPELRDSPPVMRSSLHDVRLQRGVERQVSPPRNLLPCTSGSLSPHSRHQRSLFVNDVPKTTPSPKTKQYNHNSFQSPSDNVSSYSSSQESKLNRDKKKLGIKKLNGLFLSISLSESPSTRTSKDRSVLSETPKRSQTPRLQHSRDNKTRSFSESLSPHFFRRKSDTRDTSKWLSGKVSTNETQVMSGNPSPQRPKKKEISQRSSTTEEKQLDKNNNDTLKPEATKKPDRISRQSSDNGVKSLPGSFSPHPSPKKPQLKEISTRSQIAKGKKLIDSKVCHISDSLPSHTLHQNPSINEGPTRRSRRREFTNNVDPRSFSASLSPYSSRERKQAKDSTNRFVIPAVKQFYHDELRSKSDSLSPHPPRRKQGVNDFDKPHKLGNSKSNQSTDSRTRPSSCIRRKGSWESPKTWKNPDVEKEAPVYKNSIENDSVPTFVSVSKISSPHRLTKPDISSNANSSVSSTRICTDTHVPFIIRKEEQDDAPSLYQLKSSANESITFVAKAVDLKQADGNILKNKIDRSYLDSRQGYLLDTGTHIYVWLGRSSSDYHHKFCKSQADKYIQVQKRPVKTPITIIKEGERVPAFDVFFNGSPWCVRKPNQKILKWVDACKSANSKPVQPTSVVGTPNRKTMSFTSGKYIDHTR